MHVDDHLEGIFQVRDSDTMTLVPHGLMVGSSTSV